MKQDCKIVNSESQFRSYVSNNFLNISKIIIFMDYLDNTIYFYCFCNDGSFVATSEYNLKRIYYFERKYFKLSKAINFEIDYLNYNTYALELRPKKEAP